MVPTDPAGDDRVDDSTRRRFLQGLGVAGGLTVLGSSSVVAADGTRDGSGSSVYELPPLPYDYDALEPHIEERIMRLHHDTHHKGYVTGANEALATLREMRESGDFTRVDAVKRELAFNLSGHILHSVFWEVMSPDGGGRPSGEFAAAIERDFGSFEAFKAEFSETAGTVTDSGWGMLVYDHLADRMLVVQAEDHNDIVVQGATPLLVLDVWEHAYYLQYQASRGEYVDAWWNVVDWDDVAARYETARTCEILDGDGC